MKRDGSIVSVIAICLLALTIVLYAGLKKRPRIVETKAIADVTETSAESAAEPMQDAMDRYPEINTVLVDQQRLVIGASDGIYVKPDLDEQPLEKRDAGIGITYLNTILPMGDHRYVGGDGLYLLDENYTLYLDEYDFGRRVEALMEFGEGILVGSETGLWYHCDVPVDENMPQDTLLKEGIIVTALAEDTGGLWVGTYGDGLYRFDGQNWQRRYLLRDTSMFDFVTALEYFYPNLWVGTEEAIFRYDGGKWAQMFVADSSEYHNVTSIMTTPAATYIGTDCGLLRYAADGLVEESDYSGMEIVGFCRSEKGVIVATRNDGIFTYNGKEELVSPEQLTPDYLAGDEESEIIAETDPEAFTVPYETEYAGETDY
jgi:ligand-binding sensor domain-containing protein